MPVDPTVVTWIVLLLVGGGVGLALRAVRARLLAFEERLARLDDLGPVERRLEQIESALARAEAPARLHAKLTEFTEALARLQSAVAELQQSAAAAPRERGSPSADELDGLLRRQLEGRGFERVRLLADPGALPDGSGKVAFEAYRHGALHKGAVTLQSGVVVEETARPAYVAFP